ncbi:unnamed protein product, partial [Medioppia subpectinata]
MSYINPSKSIIGPINDHFGHQLRRFSITGFFFPDFVIDAKMFDKCRHLTHLSVPQIIRHYARNVIINSFFTDIDKHLPKLQELYLIEIRVSGVDAIRPLTRCPHLQRLYFYCTHGFDQKAIDDMRPDFLALKTAVYHENNSITDTMQCVGDVYRIGVGIADTTGPAAEINLMGYAKSGQESAGIHFRTYSRAVIIEDSKG